MKFFATAVIAFAIYGAYIIGQQSGSIKFDFKQPKVEINEYRVTQYKNLKDYQLKVIYDARGRVMGVQPWPVVPYKTTGVVYIDPNTPQITTKKK